MTHTPLSNYFRKMIPNNASDVSVSNANREIGPSGMSVEIPKNIETSGNTESINPAPQMVSNLKKAAQLTSEVTQNITVHPEPTEHKHYIIHGIKAPDDVVEAKKQKPEFSKKWLAFLAEWLLKSRGMTIKKGRGKHYIHTTQERGNLVAP